MLCPMAGTVNRTLKSKNPQESSRDPVRELVAARRDFARPEKELHFTVFARVAPEKRSPWPQVPLPASRIQAAVLGGTKIGPAPPQRIGLRQA